MLPKIVREFRVDEITEDLKVGAKINPEVFSIGDVVTSPVQAKVRVGLVLFAATTSTAVARHTVVVHTAA
jgi:hypothetical protein